MASHGVRGGPKANGDLPHPMECPEKRISDKVNILFHRIPSLKRLEKARKSQEN